MIKTVSVYAMLLTGLAACSDSSDTTRNASSNEKTGSEKTGLEKTLAPQLEALEKAKGIEDALQQSVEERDQKMRENGL